ncbi:hypothetical protein SERLA73DRAFT_75173 [Serpula lacrymans var. lacrymans S7.3]|uniref:K Homology domain-containing protein n=2 Tax=Serpula lacrymans var. lacrymans TaxID=341189 RepID=F8Q2T6_SERL3|nr:uncharacterized protein SERLADRAFT_439842 [Serpula lacrymans var. lacrymans S7.9]EGN97497.1 hypothetical protein SERLA73DRAFT_75173 [Serpula lacrymans var. lacrymans S7.3]EGO23099.1 hypothetical protein SERLADRAFT_439842 [Serpula lacrymans var. lacrymans S7.9]
MSVSLLRHHILFKSLCTACLHPHPYRRYASQGALALASSTPEPTKETRLEGSSTAVNDHGEMGQPSNVPSQVDGMKPVKPSGDSAARRNPLEPTRVDKYLASIRAAGLEPTLDDIERCKPARRARPHSPQYADDYHNLVDSLCRSFSKDQLRQFTLLYKLDPIWTRSKRRKVEYAESIIEKQWGWPSLKEIERQRRDRTEVTEKSFHVNPSQLFLILGQDGADLLQLSMQYNVHISLTSDPLALRVEGLRGSLKQLSEHISLLKKDIVEEVVELPVKRPIRHDLLQRISRLANAYVENIGFKGKIRICAKEHSSLTTAKRLATRASSEVDDFKSPPLLSYTPPVVNRQPSVPVTASQQTYSVYPFLSPRSVPWTMNSGGTFRIRRVGEWLGIDATEDVQKTGGLAGGKGSFLTKSGQPCELVEALRRNASEEKQGYSRVFTASLGHMLITAPTPAQRSSIIPPLKGYFALPNILKWLESGTNKIEFVPSLPAPLLKSQPAEQKILHRLLYKKLPSLEDPVKVDSPQSSELASQGVIKFEMEIMRPTNKADPEMMMEDSVDTSIDSELTGNAEQFTNDYLGDDSQNLENHPSSIVSELQENIDEFSDTDSDLPVEVQCIQGEETTVDLLMPDRPMDVRFSVFNCRKIAQEHQPEDLRKYASNLHSFLNAAEPDVSQPRPPLTVCHDGDVYLLQSSHSIRQGFESLPTSFQADRPGNEVPLEAEPAPVISESVLDLESNQKLSICQVTCDNHTDEQSWSQFLKGCDVLSSVTFHSPSVETESDVDYLEQ